MPPIVPTTAQHGLAQQRLGRHYEAIAIVQTVVHGLVLIEAVSRIRKLFGALVLAVNAAPHVKLYLIQSSVPGSIILFVVNAASNDGI